MRRKKGAATGQLAAAGHTLQQLETARETVPELAAEDRGLRPEPLSPGYREILALFE